MMKNVIFHPIHYNASSFLARQISRVLIYCPPPDSLGDDGAVERDVEAELLWDGV